MRSGFLLASGIASAYLEVDSRLQSDGQFRNIEVVVGSKSTSFSCSIDTVGGDLVLSSDVFNTSGSSTLQEYFPEGKDNFITIPFNADWVMNLESANGDYYHDDIIFGGQKLTNYSFAIADSGLSEFSGCNLGLAPYITEGVSDTEFDGITEPFYNNILARLVEDGVTKAQAFSLWSGSDTKGSVLFGAIDHSKYEGEHLTLVPLLSRNRDGVLDVNFDYTQVPGPDIMLHGMTISENQEEDIFETSQIAIISAGALYSWLTMDMLADLGDMLGFVNQDWKTVINYDEDPPMQVTGSGLVWNFCEDLPDFNGKYLILNFSGVKIEVPIEDLISGAVPDALLFPPDNSDGKKLCILNMRTNVAPYGEGTGSTNQEIVLGYPIADKMYIAFDYDNNQAGIAPAVGNPGKSDIEEITSGIPGKTAALYSSTSMITDYDLKTSTIPMSTLPSSVSSVIPSSSRETSASPSVISASAIVSSSAVPRNSTAVSPSSTPSATAPSS